MDKEKSLSRDITISKLLRTPEQVEFFSTHTIVCGIYDNEGLESISPITDWETLSGLDKLQEKRSTLELRSRFNTHRDAKSYMLWIGNDKLQYIKNLLEKGEFVESKDYLLDNSISC